MKIVKSGIVLVLLYLQSCASSPKFLEFRTPPLLRYDFSPCVVDRGGGELHVMNKGEYLVHAEYEWASSGRRNLEISGSLADGRDAFFLSTDTKVNKLEFKQYVLEKGYDVEVDDNGFLEFDGTWIPIKAAELGCLAALRWPVTWTSSVVEAEVSKESYGTSKKLDRALDSSHSASVLPIRFEIRQPSRDITLLFTAKGPEVNGRQRVNACADIRWSRYLGLKKFQIKICYDFSAGSTGKGSLELDSQNKVDWSGVVDGSL